MNKPDIIDVLHDLNKELESNHLLEFVAMMTIANNKIRRERKKAKDSNVLSSEQIDKMQSLYSNIKNYLATNESVIKLIPSPDMKTVYKHCGFSKIEDLDDKVNKINANRDTVTKDEFDSVYGCMDRIFSSLQEAVSLRSAATLPIAVVAVLPAAVAAVAVPAAAAAAVVLPAAAPPVHVAAAVPDPAAAVAPPVHVAAAPPVHVAAAPAVPAAAAAAAAAVHVAAPAPHSGPVQHAYVDRFTKDAIDKMGNDGEFLLYYEKFDDYVKIAGELNNNASLNEETLCKLLNNNVKMLGHEKLETLYKIIDDVSKYLHDKQYFMKINPLNKFNVNNLKSYLKNPNKNPNTLPAGQTLKYGPKLMVMYLQVLIKICKYINTEKHWIKIEDNSFFPAKIIEYSTTHKDQIIKNIIINGKNYFDAIKSGQNTFLFIKKSGATYGMKGGEITNDDMYYGKYMKYKAKYMKLKSEGV